MTPAEHYEEAESLLISCQLTDDASETTYPSVGLGHEEDTDSCRNALMAAQVHAILALSRPV